jgi:hypothetical protein
VSGPSRKATCGAAREGEGFWDESGVCVVLRAVAGAAMLRSVN